MSPKLTIGMPTYDDFDGVYFSIQAIRLFHADVLPRIEFVVIDNHPDSQHGSAVKSFVEGWVPNGRYVPFSEAHGTAVAKERVFHESTTELVLCIDSHVLILPGAIARLLDYYERHPGCRDLLQGPMLDDNCCNVHASHMDPVWRGEMFGTWGRDLRADDPDGEPFEIPMHGMGLFSCRREAWPGFNPAFRGFGGEEGYIHEKFRQAGARTICLPFLRWLHRFTRANSIPYRLTRDDKLRNYLIGWTELGLDTAPAIDHFRPLLSAETIERIRSETVGEHGTAAQASTEPAVPRSDPEPSKLPLVSCLMPTHGRWSKACEALACFLAQDYPAKELIILNSHATPLVFDHPQVRIFNEPGHPDLAEMRNRLLELAAGEFYRGWDDDDLYLPWTISQGVAHIGSAAAFKPRRSWFWDGTAGGAWLAENVMEASWLIRMDVARRYRFGYGENRLEEYEPMIHGIAQEGGVRVRDFGAHASYVYRWGHGVHHMSGSHGDPGGISERTRRWRNAHQEDGGGRPLIPAEVSDSWRRLAKFSHHQAEEVERRALEVAPQRSVQTSPQHVVRRIIDVCFPGREGLIAAVSAGDQSGGAELSSPNSSLRQVLSERRVRRVYAVGRDDWAIAKYTSTLDLASSEKVLALAAPNEQMSEPIDLLLFGSDDEPAAALQKLHAIKRRLSNIAVIAVPGFQDGHTARLIRTTLEPTHSALLVGDWLVFSPRSLPEELLWETFLNWPA